jgi:hypothetical protein
MSSRKRTASQALSLRETMQKLKKQKNATLDDFMVIGIDSELRELFHVPNGLHLILDYPC